MGCVRFCSYGGLASSPDRCMINGDIPVTQTTSAVDVTSDMKYGVIPSTVHFLYESIKTDSICVAHVTIYLSAKKGKRVTMN